MKINKHIVWIIKFILVVVILLALIQSVLRFADITFTSDKARRVLVEQIKTLTQRDTYIDGQVKVTISLLPEVIVDHIHIKNIDGFSDEDFIFVSKARVQVSLIPLLTGNLVLDEIEVDDAQVKMILKKDGNYNWSFDHLLQHRKSKSENIIKHAKDTNGSKRLSIGVFRLNNITIDFIDESDNRVIEQHLSSLTVDLEDDTKPEAEINGSLQGYVYNITLESDSLAELSSGQPWSLQGAGTIAERKTRIDAILQFNEQAIAGNIDLNVEDINLGLLLGHLGVITGEDAACKELNIHADLKGDDLTDALEKAELKLHLQQGYWKWQALLRDEIRELEFDSATLSTSWGKPVEFYLDGKLFKETVRIDFNTNKLSEFFDEIDKLDVDLRAHIAGSDIALNGNLNLPIEKNRLQLDIFLKGKDLEKLNRILNSELPPFNDYSLEGTVLSNDKGYVLKASDATIGDTHFNTVIVIDTSSVKPHWTVNLKSKQLQIKDFEIIESRIVKPDISTIKFNKTTSAFPLKYEPGYRLKQIVDNPKMHLDLNLKVENVMAGDSSLGGSSFRMILRDDTLILEDLELNVPGGKIKTSASFKSEKGKVTGAWKLDINKFEYGAVVRYFMPDSPQGGIISADIDLQMKGKDFSQLFDHASGKLDVALWPRNTKTKVFDMWATNLFLIILPEIRKKESRMNCMVALMDIDDGIMKEDFFGIDTTKVWMTGNINVDFKDEYVNLSLYPRSKTAKLFAVEAPIRAQGHFTDIHLVTNPIDLTAAYLSFVTSPLHVPARRIFDDKVPEDASEACERFFDREYVKKIKAKLDAEEQKEIDEWLETP